MKKILIYIAKNKFSIYVAWIILFLPILATAIASGDIFFSPIFFILLALYLRKYRDYVFFSAIAYGFLIYFPPYQYFFRWFSMFIVGESTIKEGFLQISMLFKLGITDSFYPPRAILAALTIPAIYLINIKNKLKGKS